MANNSQYKLTLAGPDDGELPNIQRIILDSKVDNIVYIGAVHGQQKEDLLHRSHFFIMSSLTEGFSSSIVEAMQLGCIPIISEGCNMSHLFDLGLAIKANANVNEICCALNAIDAKIYNQPISSFSEISSNCNTYSSDNYSLEHIAELQFQLYCQLLKNAN